MIGFFFLKGLIIGFLIAAPVGPIGVLCLRRTLANGRWMGFISGLGAATADAVYGTLAAFGITILSSFLVGQRFWLQTIGGSFLVVLGVRALLAKVNRQGRASDAKDLLSVYGSTLILTLTNPLTILMFAAVFAGLGVSHETGYLGAVSVVFGVFMGSTSWWFILSSLASWFRDRLTEGWLVWINRIFGVLMVGFGVAMAFSAPRLIQPSSASSSIGQPFNLRAASSQGFTRAAAGRMFTFPQDYGAHNDFQTEWWYYTGNLQAEDGQRFGYQLTFFRRALLPPQKWAERPSQWATDQVYLAHFAITDVSAEQHQAFERLNRGAAGLAGVVAQPFQAWLEDWSVSEVAAGIYQLHVHAVEAHGQPVTIDLELIDEKGPVLQGLQGYSQKGLDPGDASYYYSLPRLATKGMITNHGISHEVTGSTWMDHEFSTSALSPEQVGWDWFSIQLDNSEELMVFQIRRQDGSIDPFSSGLWIRKDGSTQSLTKDDIQIKVEDTWKSTHSGSVYPSRWQVSIPALSLRLEITPLIADQEMDLSFIYWEGAVRVQGMLGGQTVVGVGYVELTGYATSMAGQF